jgi:ATP-dependent Clp protease ATP-binding subunit ClpA
MLHKKAIYEDKRADGRKMDEVRALKRNKAGLSDPHRPIGSFLFLGPTGVGKTETAKALCRILWNNPNAYIRLDMSEYMERHAVARLIGSPPGYVGYDEGGQLTEIIRRRPYAVILFDEIEKAHPDTFNILLQLLDDGRLTDAKGRVVNFKNTVIVMTSNVGSSAILDFNKRGEFGFKTEDKQAAAEKTDKIREKVMESLREQFRPEFLNRVDDIIVFQALTEDELSHIVELQLAEVAERLTEKHITLSVTAAAKTYLAKEGYNPDFGARPLKRLIQNKILDELALKLLEGVAKEGSTVTVDAKKNLLTLRFF